MLWGIIIRGAVKPSLFLEFRLCQKKSNLKSERRNTKKRSKDKGERAQPISENPQGIRRPTFPSPFFSIFVFEFLIKK